MSTALVWLRQDLRCTDNPALAAACAAHHTVVPLYILDTSLKPGLGAAQHWWLHHSLAALAAELDTWGMRLCLKRGPASEILYSLVTEYSIDSIYWNRCYEPAQIKRDQAIKQQLKATGRQVMSFNGSLLHEPWTVQTQNEQFFKVFTPFWKKCLQQTVIPKALSIRREARPHTLTTDTLDAWSLLPKHPNWAKGFSAHWTPGALGAQEKLQHFIKNHVAEYKTARNMPAQNATSFLSPHLHFGEISPWQIWRAISAQCYQKNPGAVHFLQELGWREFSYHLLYHFPELPTHNFRSEFDAFPWHANPKALALWQQGRTGFPLIDAGMRELWQNGIMHNRVRMVVASFLIKDLFIDWREGAEWFYSTLLDADLANNSASWQWVAGSGADAAPYFRIFNPYLQSEKFDKDGTYIKRFVPELRDIPTAAIHAPWEDSSLHKTLEKLEYPRPLVSHDLARKQALLYYAKIRQ